MAKNYLHVQNTSCNMYMAFTFLVYYLTFPLLLRSYNFNNIISENILTVTGELTKYHILTCRLKYSCTSKNALHNKNN